MEDLLGKKYSNKFGLDVYRLDLSFFTQRIKNRSQAIEFCQNNSKFNNNVIYYRLVLS